jgi:ferric-dicitrate binding protein FerR (iron transport regulator)
MVLYVGDYVKTGERSSAIISFMDMSTFVMKPETEIIISSAYENENVIKLLVGDSWANVKRMFKDRALDIEMCQAVYGIKGTTFVVEDSNGVSRLKVIEGQVEFRSKVTGEKKIVKTGETIYADKKGLEKVAKFDVERKEVLGIFTG